MRWYCWALMAIFVLPLYAQPCPTICVIIPEEDRCVVPRPVPDPACETAIILAFIEYGFTVVDQKQIKLTRMSDPQIIEAAKNGDPSAIRGVSERGCRAVQSLVSDFWAYVSV